MNPVFGACPVCGEAVEVVRLHCRSCDTSIEGRFTLGRLDRLSSEQLEFVEAFIRNEGKLNRLEKELGMSYPTLRSRLQAIIKDLGYEVGGEPTEALIPESERHQILDDLAAGKLTSEEAMHLLQGG